MASILLYQYYDNARSVNQGTYTTWEADQHSYNFNTDTRTVEHTSYKVEGGDERDFDVPPYVFPVNEAFLSECQGTTKREYFHNGTGSFSIQETPDSLECGWIPTFDIQATIVDATCFGSSTGNILIQVTSYFPPYNYLWDDGTTTKDRYNVPAGDYTLTVIDSKGYIGTKFVSIAQNTPIQVIGTIGDDSITLEVTGGIAPYTFLWNDGEVTKNRSKVTPGTYTCTVRDAIGCIQSVSFLIESKRFFFSKNPVLLQLQAQDYTNKPNLRFICEVWVEEEYLSDNFTLATPEPFEHPADKNGATQFDVAEILDAFVEPQLPEYSQNSIKRVDKSFKRFYLRYTEAYGNPVVLAPFSVQENRYVLCGGLSEPEYYAGTYFSSFRPNRKPFFTWDPVIKDVLKDQPEYLYFMPDSFELTDFRVKVKVSFADGSTTTIQPFVQEGIRRFELYCIPVGYEQLNLGALSPEKKVRSWEVYVVDGFNNTLSETRHYNIDNRYYEHVRFFLYANSIGGYNTLAATGNTKLTVDPQAQLLEKNKTQDANSGDSITISKYSKRTLAMSTGYKSKTEMQALQDFLNSEHVVLAGEDRYEFGRLSDKSSEISDDSKTLHAIAFDFILTKMHRYTPDLKLSGYTDESELLKPLSP